MKRLEVLLMRPKRELREMARVRRWPDDWERLLVEDPSLRDKVFNDLAYGRSRQKPSHVSAYGDSGEKKRGVVSRLFHRRCRRMRPR